MLSLRPPLLLALLGSAGLWSVLARPARAATVQKLNDEKDKVLVLLTQAEMAAYEEGERVVVEVSGRDARFVVSATLDRMNPVKQTVVLVLDMPDERFARRQTVRFLSVFWNTASSPVIGGFGQYHQFPRAFAEARAGYFLDHVELESKRKEPSVLGGDEPEKSQSDISGYLIGAEGYIVFDPERFGAGLAFERRSAVQLVNAPKQDELSTDVTINLIRPGAWIGFKGHYRLGLSYDYALLDLDHGSGKDVVSFSYDLGRPRLQLVSIAKDGEWGVEYTDRSEFEAEASVDYATPGGTATTTIADTVKLPAELRAFFRDVSSPVFIWGASLSYLFFERDRGEEPLRPKPKIPELLRLSTTFEHRLGDGDKLDWGIFYEGSKAPTLTLDERTILAGGFNLTYQAVVATGLLAGGTITVHAGGRTEEGGEVVKTDDVYTGYGANLLLFAHYDFELDVSGRRRRR